MQQIDILITHGLVLTLDEQDTTLEDGALAIVDGQIAAVGHADELANRFTASEVIDATGHAVLPGLINGHSHLAMTLFRGLGDDLVLAAFLDRLWQAELAFIRHDTVTVGTRLALAELIRSGTTTALDMYWFPTASAEVAREAGFRLITGGVYVEFEGPDAIATTERTARARAFCERYAGDRFIVPCVQPHSTYAVTPEHLREAQALADEYDALLHLHACETRAEVEAVWDLYGRTPVEQLVHLDALTERTVLAHVVYPTADDIDWIAERGASVVHCPMPNLKTGAGVAPVLDLHAAGIPLLLGTTGAASHNDLDLWKAIRLTAVLHKGTNRTSTAFSAHDVLHMVTRGAATALGLGHLIGSLETGKRADVILINLEQPHLTPQYDVISNLVYAADRGDVSTVLIDGQVVMRSGELQTIDVQQAMDDVRAVARRISSDLPRRR